jgi:hypothetical protein
MYVVPDVFTPRDFVKVMNEELAGKAEIELRVVDRDAFVANRGMNEELWCKCVTEWSSVF